MYMYSMCMSVNECVFHCRNEENECVGGKALVAVYILHKMSFSLLF